MDDWNAATAYDCNEEVKTWVKTHTATIHITKLVFDLDCPLVHCVPLTTTNS